MKLVKFLKIKLIILLIGISSINVFAQENALVFQPSFKKEKLNQEVYYKINDAKDSIQITSLKFYISKLELILDNKIVWREELSYHLIDAFDEKTLALHLPSNISYNKIKFQLGIDSLTNVSGALGGDLDPTKGMYWTWQSGYINLKLEGISSLCKTRHNEFQFHLGGYQHPYNCLQTVFVSVKSSNSIKLNIDLSLFFKDIQLDQMNHIMSPRKEAVDLSSKIIESFNVSYE